MIKSREELMALSSEWATMAKNDLRNQILAFMESMGTNEEELANALCISSGELYQIIEGNGEISLSTFAKILIATDNVIEIKPLSAMGMQNMPSPRQARRGTPAMPPMNRGGGRPTGIPMGRDGRPMEMPMGQDGRPMRMPMGRDGRPMEIPMGQDGLPMMPMGQDGRPMRMPMGRDGRPMRMPMGQDGRPMGHGGQMPERFAGMPGMKRKIANARPQTNQSPNRSMMIDEMQRNFWDSEVDVARMSDEELFHFLNSKASGHSEEAIPQVRPTANSAQVEGDGQRTNRVSTQAVDPTNDFMSMLGNVLEQNPHLREEIAKYMPKQS